MRILILGLAITIGISAGAGTLDAQSRAEHAVTAREVAASLASNGHVGLAVRTLRRVAVQSEPEALDAIADSIVAFVLRSEDRRVALDAVSALGAAALPTGEGQPYAGAASRLQRIAMTRRDLAAAALFGLAQSANQPEAISMLVSVATSQNASAAVALRMLVYFTGNEGLEAARTLYVRRSVREKNAVEQLEHYAHGRGWVR